MSKPWTKENWGCEAGKLYRSTRRLGYCCPLNDWEKSFNKRETFLLCLKFEWYANNRIFSSHSALGIGKFYSLELEKTVEITFCHYELEPCNE